MPRKEFFYNQFLVCSEQKNYNFIAKKNFSSFEWILKVCCCVLKLQRNLGKREKKTYF
jgi:hypothetical protein